MSPIRPIFLRRDDSYRLSPDNYAAITRLIVKRVLLIIGLLIVAACIYFAQS